MAKLPDSCATVIIGGGIIGCSVAYHLAKLGRTDFVVLEQDQLTSGTTWHAAGLIGQLRASANVTQLLKYSVELYEKLGEETGQQTGWKQNGGLRLACRRERVQEIRRQISMARSFGLEMHYLTPDEVKNAFPALDTSDVLGAAFLPTDGQANPSDLTQALAKGARDKGGEIIERCRAESILAENGRVSGVVTDHGTIRCETLVNCAGMWSRHIASLSGVNVPIMPMKHHYMVTGKIDGITADLPTVRDPDRLIYFKEEVGGLVFGGYELNPKPWRCPDPARSSPFALLDFDIDHFESLMQSGLERMPAMKDADVKQMICGPESFTPDGNFIVGEAPELKNYFVATGFNAFGIASAGGVGMVLAEWIAGGRPPYDVWPVDVLRFGRPHMHGGFVRDRTQELCAKHYTMAWPHEEHESGRPVFTSPLYGRLKDRNACFGEKLGWERPNWFARPGQKPVDEPAFGRANWFENVGVEHRAIRNGVGIIDQSSFAKFTLAGPGALQALEWMCANRMDRAPGSIIYTQMLSERGGIVADITVTRIAEDEFYIVSGTGYATHDRHHIRRHTPKGCRADLADVTNDYATLSISGPDSRALLADVLDASLDNADFPFGAGRIVEFGDFSVRALRVSFAGELGWELHVPVAASESLYLRICEAGESLGLTHVGYRALESLRLEKGFLALGSDIGPDYTPLEAGLSRFVRKDGDRPFLGQAALLEQEREMPLRRRLACFTSEDARHTVLGRETIYRNGERVGWISSGGWGHSVAKNIAYGYVRNADGVPDDFLFAGEYELEIEDVRVPFAIERRAPYDPEALRMRS